MITGLLAILSSIVGAFMKVLAWLVKTVPWYIWIGLIVAIVIFYYGVKAGYNWGGSQGGLGCSCRSCRQFVCGRTPRPPRPERTHEERGIVGSVTAANSFVLIQERGRRTTERPVTIRYIVVVGQPELCLTTRQLLPVGSAVTIEALGGRFMGDGENQPGLRRQEGEEESEATTAETTDSLGQEVSCSVCNGTGKCFAPPEWLFNHSDDAEKEFECWACGGSGRMVEYEARGLIVGTVKNANGQDVGLELVKQGLATCQDDAPANYKAAEKVAKNRRKGA